MSKALSAAFIAVLMSSTSVALAADVTSPKSELERVWEALEAAQSKIDELENRSNASPFTPPKSLGLDEDSKIDPVQSAYPIAKGDNLRLAQVHFNVSSIDLSPGGERLTREAAEWIKSLPSKKIVVAGYSDTVGPADVNKEISKQRADAVASILIEAGIDPDAIEVVGLGEEGIPEATGDDVAEPLNRCVGIFAVPSEDEENT